MKSSKYDWDQFQLLVCSDWNKNSHQGEHALTVEDIFLFLWFLVLTVLEIWICHAAPLTGTRSSSDPRHFPLSTRFTSFNRCQRSFLVWQTPPCVQTALSSPQSTPPTCVSFLKAQRKKEAKIEQRTGSFCVVAFESLVSQTSSEGDVGGFH